jgi:NitT/TauT family transport system substrate-binding protein
MARPLLKARRNWGVDMHTNRRALTGRLARTFLNGALSAALVCCFAAPAFAADKVTFLTSWFAQAEHGGFYEAEAEGLYKKAGLDVTIEMGGPQINGMQLLLGGETDFMIGYDVQVLKALERHIPVTTVATSFQFDLQGIMTHANIHDLSELKGDPILIASSSRLTFWPWLQKRFGYTDDQARPYTFNLQPFFADPNVAQQAYPSSEPYAAEKAGQKVNFFLFAKYGYPPYGSTIVTTKAYANAHPDVTARFVKASLQGWVDYIKNPAPANALIQAANPKMSSDQIAYAIRKLKETHAIDGGDAATQGVGIMTAARWKATYDFLVSTGLLNKDVDWRSAFTDKFVKGLKVGM